MRLINIKKEIDVMRMLDIEVGNIYDDMPKEDFDYLDLSLKMPLKEIQDVIIFYDQSKPKYDELKLIENLKNKYQVERKDVIKRIKQVRKIMKYFEQINKQKIKKLK